MTPRTRLAPSPTGALHLGNARTFLVNWALARQRGWQIVLRIDDLDGPRIKPAAAQQAIDDLRWLGLSWDSGPTYQNHDLAAYQRALEQLAGRGLIYPCCCTRAAIEAASAPHEGEHELRYPGTCRPAPQEAARFAGLAPSDHCWRVRVPPGPRQFVDEFSGRQTCDLQQQVGDFQVATKSGVPSYQLAVVVDDAAQQITHIVRGDDLISSTPRQDLLRELLGFAESPRYWHLPLVVGPDGRRLAKRHGDSRLRHYRECGTPPQRVLGLLRQWCGGGRKECDIEEFLDEFDLERLPRTRITMTEEHDRWLLGRP